MQANHKQQFVTLKINKNKMLQPLLIIIIFKKNSNSSRDTLKSIIDYNSERNTEWSGLE